MRCRDSSRAALVTGSVLLGASATITARCFLSARPRHEMAIVRAAELPRSAWDRVVLHVPHLPGSVVLDGDTDDPGWTASTEPARTGPFLLATGAPARPYSDSRLVWGDGHLYLALYAADEDIRSRVDQMDGPVSLDDAFRLVFTRGDAEYAIDVSPTGVLADAVRNGGGPRDYAWNSGAHVSHEHDGTLNDPSDSDEEWVIEMAIPFESLGMAGHAGERIGFAAWRCDTPKNEPRVCASWGGGERRGEIVLD
jgi:hypothetical protein